MRLRDIKNEFPQMPEEMRRMVEREVEMQLNEATAIRLNQKKHMGKKSMIAVLAATMALGTTVFAGTLYQMHGESVGEYGVETKTENMADDTTENILPEVPEVELELDYLPEGMVQTEEGKYSYETSMYHGGVSIFLYRMDTGDSAFEMLDTNCISNEDITIGEYDGVYLLFHTLDESTITFNQQIYVAYTDVHYVMQMYIGSDVTKEEAIKIAEGVKLTPTENVKENTVSFCTWSEYLASSKEAAEAQAEAAPSSNIVISKDMMKNTHAIGESFFVNPTKNQETEGLMAKVSEVQVLDDIGLLDKAYMDDDFTKSLEKETDSNGKLLPAKKDYIRLGNGIDTLDEIVSTKEVPQKLVYVTVEYTNTGNSKLSEALFMGNLLKLAENDGQMTIYREQPQANDAWDVAQITGMAQWQEMYYFDVRGGERNNNYIDSINPGETVTVHMGWFVPEEDLEYLYLNLDTFGGCYEFDSHALAVGYVDIRQ